MATTTVAQFAAEINTPVATMMDQLQAAGVPKSGPSDALVEADKNALNAYLHKLHGTDAPRKITLTRKLTSEIKQADSTGKARTIQVEVRKRRVLVQREAVVPEPVVVAPPKTEPVVPDAPVVVAVVEPIAPPPPPVVEVPAVVAIAPPPPAPAPESEPPPAPNVQAVPEPAAPTTPFAAAPEAASEQAEPEVPAKPQVTRASIIGERELKQRAEQDRRQSALLARQALDLRERQERERQAQAAAAIENDPFVRELQESFGGNVKKSSIQPLP